VEHLQPLNMVLRTTKPRPGVAVVAVAGECDLYEASRLEAALAAVCIDDGRVLLDLSELRFLDSTALGALVKAKRRLEQSGCELVLLAPSREVMRTLSLTGVDSVFAIVDGDDGEGAEAPLPRNATMFRAVNERICELTRSWELDEVVYFVCECGDEGCARPVGLALEAFERIAAGTDATAIVHPEHVANGSNGWRVLESGKEYVVVTPSKTHAL